VAAGDNSTNAATTAWGQREFNPLNRGTVYDELNIPMIGTTASLAVTPLAAVAINSGTLNIGDDNLYGYPNFMDRRNYVYIKSVAGAGASSGHVIGLYNNGTLFTNTTQIVWDFLLRLPSDVICLAGYGDAIGTAESTDALQLSITNNLLYGVMLNNGSRTITTTSFSVPTNVWLTASIATTNDVATLLLLTNGVQAWTENISGIHTNAGRFLYPAIKMWSSGPASTNGQTLGYVDNFYWRTDRRSR